MKKKIIKFKLLKRNFYRKWFQKIADKIIVRLENSKSPEEFSIYCSLGVQIDFMAKVRNIYLK